MSNDDSKIKVAITGCGKIAGGYDETILPGVVRTHALAYANNERTQLVAAHDINTKNLKRFSKTWNVCNAYSDLEEMLQKCSPQIVSVCSPASTHLKNLEQCLKYDFIKAVWCEKPLVTKLHEAKSITAEYERSKKYLFVNYQRNYNPIINSFKRRFNEELGKILKVVVYYTKGVLYNGSHAISLLVDWFGKVERIKLLSNDHSPSMNYNPNIDALLKFRDFPAYLIGLDDDAYALFEIQFYGTRGTACLTNRSGPELLVHNKAIHDQRCGFKMLNPQGHIEDTETGKVFCHMLDHIIQTMSSRNYSSPDWILETARVCHELSILNSTYSI